MTLTDNQKSLVALATIVLDITAAYIFAHSLLSGIGMVGAALIIEYFALNPFFAKPSVPVRPIKVYRPDPTPAPAQQARVTETPVAVTPEAPSGKQLYHPEWFKSRPYMHERFDFPVVFDQAEMRTIMDRCGMNEFPFVLVCEDPVKYFFEDIVVMAVKREKDQYLNVRFGNKTDVTWSKRYEYAHELYEKSQKKGSVA